MRIGLFGGTFNPVHSGHVQVVLDIGRRFDLDRIIFIPCHIPPHKDPGQIADSSARYDMVRLAVEGYRGLSASDVELRRRGMSYTIHTLEHFRGKFTSNCELFFILGVDAFMETDTWNSFDRLFSSFSFIIMPRGGSNPHANLPENILGYLRERISPGYEYDQGGFFFRKSLAARIYLSDIEPVDLCSTLIRKTVRAGGDITTMVPPKVARYIKTRGLYR